MMHERERRRAKVSTISGKRWVRLAILAGNDAEAVMLDFVQPLAAGRQLVGFGRKAWRDEPGGEGTLQHVAQIELGRGDCNYSAQGMRLRIDARRSHSELAILRFARLR